MKTNPEHPHRWTRWIAVLAVSALAFAGCSSDDTEADGTDDATNATAEEATPDDTTDEQSTDPDPVEDEPEPETVDEEAIVLTDSFRGVTAETIKVGYTSIDFEELNELFGLDLTIESYATQAEIIVDMYNARGGILGRQIELVQAPYLPTGPTSADEACTKLGEDEEVFATLGGFAGPGAVEVNSCFSELYDTILVGGTPRTDQTAAAEGLWITASMSSDRRNTALVSLLSQAGELDGLGTVMVIGSSPEEVSLVDALADELEAAGVEVAVRDVVTTVSDRPATSAAVEVWIEQARSNNVTSVFLMGEDSFRNEDFFTNAPDLTYIMGNGDSIGTWQTEPPAGLSADTRVLSANEGADTAVFDDPEMQECLSAVEEALGIEVRATSELGEDEEDYYSGTVSTCRTFALFVQVAEAAGPELTNESWVAALDNVPDLVIPGYEFASLSSTKLDARDQMLLVEYDIDTLSFEELTPPIDVG